MPRRRAALFAFAALVLSCASPRSEDSGATQSSVNAASTISGTAIFLRDWKWRDVTANLRTIRDASYDAILLSPHTATCSGAYGGEGFDPSDFTSFDGGFGSQGDLQRLVDTAHALGLQVYATMVMNHMCTHPDYRYARFSWNDFHHDGDIRDWNDRWQLENGDLFGLNDLAQESPYVRGQLFDFVVKTNDMGFDGYKWDAAKHVPVWYWGGHVLNETNAWGKFNFGEVYEADLAFQGEYVNAGMAVTDYALYFAMKDAFRFGGDLAQLDGAGMAGKDGANAVTFVENQDVGPPENRDLAYAFITGYTGYPFFANVDIHDARFANLAWVHRYKAYGRYVNRWREHDVLVFEREANLVVGINQTGAWQSRWIDSSWSRTRLHDYSGHAGDTWTADDRRVLVSIPPMSWVMLAP